jgi:hypothetical protein
MKELVKKVLVSKKARSVKMLTFIAVSVGVNAQPWQ